MGKLLRVCWVVGAAAGVVVGQTQAPAPEKAEQPVAEKPASQPAPAPATPAEPKITPLAHVEVRGTGPVPVILIPGLVCDWTVFDAFMTRNADKYTMYAVTLPGFGGSEAPPTPSGGSFAEGAWLTNAERAVLGLVKDKGLDHPVILGQSLGGFVALRTAAHNPGVFKSVIVLNSMPAWPIHPPGASMSPKERAAAVDGDIASRAKQATDKEWTDEQSRWIAASVPDGARAKAMIAAAAAVPKATSSRYMLEYLASDLSGEIGKIDAPTLVVAPLPMSEPHPETLRVMWRQQYAPVLKATVVFFEDSGEFITEDSPADLDRAVDQFLSGKHVEGKSASAKAGEPVTPAPPPETAPAAPPKPEGVAPSAPGEGPKLPPSLVHPAPGSDGSSGPTNPKPTEPK